MENMENRDINLENNEEAEDKEQEEERTAESIKEEIKKNKTVIETIKKFEGGPYEGGMTELKEKVQDNINELEKELKALEEENGE